MIGLDRRATRRYLVLIVCTAVLALVGAAATITFLAQINAAIASPPGDLPRRAVYAALLMLVATGAGYASQVLLVRVNFGLAHDIRMSVARSVAYAPLETIDTFGVQRILTILIGDVRSLIDFIGFMPNFVPSGLMVLAGLAYLLHLDLLIGGAMVVGVALLMVVGARATLGATQVLIKGRIDDEGLRQTISQLVYGAKEVKLNADRRDKLVERDIRRLSRSAANNYIRCMHMYRSYDEIVKLTYFGFFLAALAYGVTHPHFGVAGTGAVIIIFFFLQNPIQLTNFVWERIAPFRIAYGKLRDLHGQLRRSAPGQA
jgi:putative ATP-binding cassette transporter